MTAHAHKQQKPNIVWIVCEDISPFIGAYGFNELRTPNIDQLAREGVRYTHVYTTAGVCAPSRSAIITGMYQTSIGTHQMRTTGDPKYQPVPSYSAVIPEYIKCFPEFLRKAGYFCSNNSKQDYQFEPPVTVWDENGITASFRNRPDNTPFFSVFNFAITHESKLFPARDSLLVNPDAIIVPPIYPDTKSVRHDIARLYSNIMTMDNHIGELIRILKEDGLYENSIIFFYSDHGGALPWMKREVLERGTHIPMVIRFPQGKNGGTVNGELISAIDLAPTVLSLAGIRIPSYMQGQDFSGTQKPNTPRKYVFAARDRMDTEYDRVRMVRDMEYRYLRNYMPEKTYYQDIEFRLGIPMMKEILEMKERGALNSTQASWFKSKPHEELYDVGNDPFELTNLAGSEEYGIKLRELRTALEQWKKKYGDMGEIPEGEMIQRMWNGKSAPPVTAAPKVIKTKSGVKLSCSTPGASIGYRIASKAPENKTRVVQSWDFAAIMGNIKNGTQIPVEDKVWKVYDGEIINLTPGDTLKINAMRIGYKPALADYIDGQLLRD